MNNSWKKKLGGVCVMSIVSISFAFTQQSKELSFFIQKALQNSPLLNDYRNQQEQGRIDSLRTRAGWGPQVSLNSTNYYAPVLNGWGYDQSITNGANLNTGVSVSKEIVGKQNQRNQLEALSLQNRSLRNTGKISEQELKKSVTSQFLVAFGDWQQYLFNDEMLSLLKKEELILKKLAERGTYKQTEYLSFLVSQRQQSLQVERLKSQYQGDYASLGYLCGIEDTTFQALADPMLHMEVLPSFTQTTFHEQYVIDSLKLRNSDKQIDFSYKPKVSIFADGGYNSSLIEKPFRNFGVGAGFTVSIPLYDGGQRKMQHNRIALDEITRRGNQVFFASQYHQQINRLLQQLQANRRLTHELNQQITYTRALLDANHKLLEIGEVHIADYILAIGNYLTAQNMLVANTIEGYQIVNELNYWNREK